jgi:hypothetical protein
MFKVIRMVKRGDKLPAEFRQEWLEHNRELRKAAAKLVASVAADTTVLGDEPPPYDGISALFFSTVEEATKAEDKSLGKDAISVVAEDKVLFERPDGDKLLKAIGQLKVVTTAQRKKELSAAQFKDAALKAFAKVESKSIVESPIQKIVASFAVPEEGKAPAFDSMIEIYFATTDDIKAAFESPVIGFLRKDEESYVQMDAPEIRIVAEEHVL